MGIDGNHFYKIGIAKDIKDRIRRIANESGTKVKVLYALKGTRYPLARLEEKLKRDFVAFKNPPPTKFGGWTECFGMDILGLDKGV